MSAPASNSRKVAWMIWMIASIFYAYQYILRVMPNVMINDIMQQFGITAAAFGQFSGVYYIGYALMHLPVGIMLDRYGPRKVMTACILLTVFGLTPLLFTTHWAFPIAGRFLIGLGSSAAILGVFKIVRMSFVEKRFSRMLSISVTIGLIGAIYGGAPVMAMRESLGYEGVIQTFAAMGILLACATYWIVPEQDCLPSKNIIADVKEVLMNRKVISACLFAGLMVGPLEGFADVWGTTYLTNVYGIEGALAASLPSMMYIGMCFGGPALSLIAEKIGSYPGTIMGAGIVMLASFCMLLSWYLPPAVISFSFFLVGVCCGYQILAIYKVSTYVRNNVAGLTTALANMIIMLFGYAFHTVIGAVVHAFGGALEPQALTYGMAVIPIALCMGTIGFAYLLASEKKTATKVVT